VRLCVQCTVQSETVFGVCVQCTVQSETVCTCTVRLLLVCVQCTVQGETVCTVQSKTVIGVCTVHSAV